MTEPFLVSELFFSIQGESSHAGLANVFIRLAGCNLRCSYCDARYTYDETPDRIALGDVLRFVEGYPGFPVEITGGEPLLQEGVYALMENLLRKGHRVLLETNGTICLSRVPAGVIKIMDVKCPGSTIQGHLHGANLDLMGPEDELKFVLSHREDYDWAVAFLNRNPQAQRIPTHFSPVPGRLDPADLAGWILEDRLPVRLQLQLHKIIWPGADRGK
ncbi:MAG: radical SAM protein [Proteobacteria bacterium]|nr:radical SAM protein [Pseudomonadota bacterium]MBU1688339.1 radical SAM protein [Pseudomonadota bacterium]